jgi:hypothetical protein
LVESYRALLRESLEHDADFNTELFEDALDTALALLRAPEPSTLAFLAAWNEARLAAADVDLAVTYAEDPYPNAVVEEFTEGSAFLHLGLEQHPELQVLLVAQAL